MKAKVFTLIIAIGASVTAGAQTHIVQDSVMIRKMFDQALVQGESYENLRSLCKDVGNRLSGSPEAEKAITWGKEVMERLGVDTVYLQPIEVPFWQRGDREIATLTSQNDMNLDITSLGGSVATNGPLEAELIEVQGLEEMKALDESKVKGKIVFYNKPMDPRLINTFESYGGCSGQRFWGAVEAAEKGAVGVIVRSLTLLEDDDHPHTGSMAYKDGVTKIPSVAVTTSHANVLHEQLRAGEKVTVKLDINPKTNPWVKSYNVIGEIRGTVSPEKVITVGGHLDSWDVGEGAHDDGAGVVHSIEVLRIMKALDYKPKHTVRAILYMNEENGNRGGQDYARIAKEKKEFHVALFESDRGGFSPRGFSIKGNEAQVEFVRSFRGLLEEYGLHFFEPGFPGVDIYPMLNEENIVNPNMLMMGLVPDSQRYFDYHHSTDDVFENVNKRELELGCASLAAMIYLVDKHVNELP